MKVRSKEEFFAEQYMWWGSFDPLREHRYATARKTLDMDGNPTSSDDDFWKFEPIEDVDEKYMVYTVFNTKTQGGQFYTVEVGDWIILDKKLAIVGVLSNDLFKHRMEIIL